MSQKLYISAKSIPHLLHNPMKTRPRKARPAIPTGKGNFFFRKNEKQWPIDAKNVPKTATIYYRKSIEHPDRPGLLKRITYCCWTNSPEIAYFLVDNMDLENLELDNNELFMRQLMKMYENAASDYHGHLVLKPKLAELGRDTHAIVSRQSIKAAIDHINTTTAPKALQSAITEFRRALLPTTNKRKKRSTK